ncbi:hypothetical protein BMS3Bbin14_00828 [bacterium BMS3Bbin14]|nr:hypothetical protein BMS3Abin13_01953 [bacterium BMS3Abin13]GBE52358.1 hypothetical protein BMS3Bbin14_00828 [bacterium BMS3Bbin14]HDK43605.1 DUF1257 domain-containing protein [Desulfobacteraceae bacterium]HDL98099.1 DUF1257 domain-containing protein [Desulfobacteraceae bacterium]HDO29783.1 DUF1257 domain-containing protein [Desulfobacteraceae bacterium]
MSHFTTMKTRLVNRKYLVAALKDLGFQPQEGPVRIRGYEGQETEVEVKVPTGNPEYDLGFRKVGKTYELVADWYGITDIRAKTFMAQLLQRYAYHAVSAQVQARGFEIVEDESLQDHTIHLTLRRCI